MSESQTKTLAKSEAQTPATSSRLEGLWQPFAALRGEVDRVFDNVWRGFGGGMTRQAGGELQPLWRLETAFGVTAPAVNLVESENEYRVTAELPGMDAKDVEVSMSGDILAIKGEKKEEREEKSENYHLSERRFGSFRRSFQLPRGVDRERIEARFDKGVLTVTLPKTAEAAAQQKKIEVKQGS